MPDINQQTTRSKVTAGLYIVATPIGNIADITLRALDILKQVDFIACEDTRVSRKLLSHYGIQAPLLHYDDHSHDSDRNHILKHIEHGKAVALISDAGTPLISDPGYKLVRQAQKQGLYITTLPGASSLTTAITLAGLPTNRFLFEGFLPPKEAGRQKALKNLHSIPATLIFFESARRLDAALQDMLTVLGDREAAVVREITKLFEETRRDKLSALLHHYQTHGLPKGEVVILVAPPEEIIPDNETIDLLITEALQSMSVKDAVQSVTEQTGLPRKVIYTRTLELQTKRKDDKY